jgi:hypothetical protein
MPKIRRDLLPPSSGLKPEDGRQQFLLNVFHILHDVTSQRTVPLILKAVTTSNLTNVFN